MINHDSTPDHSIIGIRIIRQGLSSLTKGKYIRTWSKANWNQFSSYIYSKHLDYSSISSKIDSEKVIKNLYQYIEEGNDKAVLIIEIKTKYAPRWSVHLEWHLTKVKCERKQIAATQRSVE
jgi:indole-3-glycerol phosphate synthase